MLHQVCARHFASSFILSPFVFTKNLNVFHRFSYCPCLLQRLRSAPFNKIRANRKHSEEINMASSVLTIHSASLPQRRHSASSYFTQPRQSPNDPGSVSLFSKQHNKVRVKLTESEEERLCKDMLSFCSSLLRPCWQSYLVFFSTPNAAERLDGET